MDTKKQVTRWNAAKQHSKNEQNSAKRRPIYLARTRIDQNHAKGPTDLHDALRKGDLDQSWQLINNGIITCVVDPSTGNNELHLLLRSASTSGVIWTLFQQLLGHGVDHSLENNDGDTPVHLCLYNQDYVHLRWLLKAGANYLADNKHGMSPYKYIIMTGDCQALRELPKEHVEKISAAEKLSIAKTAVEKGQANILQYAFEVLRVDVNDKIGDISFLDKAVKVLLETKSIQDEILKVLIIIAANMNQNTSRENAALSMVKYKPRSPSQKIAFTTVFDMLLAGTSDVIVKDSKETLLHIAVLFSNVFVVKYLLDKGLDISEQTKTNETALHYAAKRGSNSILKVLLNHVKKNNMGYLITDQGPNGTPLSIAKKEKNLKMVALLQKRMPKKIQFDSPLPTELWVSVLSFFTLSSDLLAVAWTCRTFALLSGGRVSTIRDPHVFRSTSHWLDPAKKQLINLERRQKRKTRMLGSFRSSIRRKSPKLRRTILSKSEPRMMLKENVLNAPLKVVLYGETDTGKTQLITRFCDGIYSDICGSPFQDYKPRVVSVGEKRFMLHVYESDTRLNGRSTENKHNANISVICCDVSKNWVQNNVPKWLREVGSRDTVVALALLKCDITERKVSNEDIQAFCRSNPSIIAVEVSAKKDMNVDKLFTVAVREIQNRIKPSIRRVSSLMSM